MLLIIDNYDSFVHNIYHVIDYPSNHIEIVRNDEIDIDEIDDSSVKGVIISPGPMSPKEAGISNAIIMRLTGKLPILGICLGHQCIGHVFDCQVKKYDTPTHGRGSDVALSDSRLFAGLPETIHMGRYHSLCIERTGFNHSQLAITAESGGLIMGIEHKKYPVYGVQFHPESIISGSSGKRILDNFAHILGTN